MEQIDIRETKPEDKEWITALLKEQWGSEVIVTRGKIHQANQLPGFIALLDNEKVGLVTYILDNNECEIITLNSLVEEKGTGTALLEKVIELARDKKCKRVWLITTNDNTEALKFYQKRGFTLKALYPNAIKESRKLKPEIPEMGENGIPIRDEIEMEMILD